MTDKEILAEVSKMNKELLTDVSKLIENQTEKLQVIIENDITKRINALFDGYKLTHEKQWELERKIGTLEKRIEELEIRVS